MDQLEVLKKNIDILYNVIYYYNKIDLHSSFSLHQELVQMTAGNEFYMYNANSRVMKIFDASEVTNFINQKRIAYNPNSTSTNVHFSNSFMRILNSDWDTIYTELDWDDEEYQDLLFQQSMIEPVLSVKYVEEIYYLLTQLPIKRTQGIWLGSAVQWDEAAIDLMKKFIKMMKAIYD